MSKPILYIDMDNVLVDFQSGIDKMPKELLALHQYSDDIPGIFALMEPVVGAQEAVAKLNEKYDIQILTTGSWNNPTVLNDKLAWVKRYFPTSNVENGMLYKKVNFSHHKDLFKGYALIDDNMARNGAGFFEGRKIWLQLPELESQCNENDLRAIGVDISQLELCHSWDEVLEKLME